MKEFIIYSTVFTRAFFHIERTLYMGFFFLSERNNCPLKKNTPSIVECISLEGNRFSDERVLLASLITAEYAKFATNLSSADFLLISLFQ